jgi:hypothetical protein
MGVAAASGRACLAGTMLMSSDLKDGAEFAGLLQLQQALA